MTVDMIVIMYIKHYWVRVRSYYYREKERPSYRTLRTSFEYLMVYVWVFFACLRPLGRSTNFLIYPSKSSFHTQMYAIRNMISVKIL